jgi:hypothetical protein
MMDLWSARFNKKIIITNHAQARMLERHISGEMLKEIIDTGETKHKDITRIWIFKHYPEREDNLVCAAVESKTALIVKTVMVNWQLEE